MTADPGATAADSRFVATQQQVSALLGAEAAILSMKDGVYYGLDPVGTRVWDLLAEPRSLDELTAAMLAEYEVDEDTLRRDLAALLEDLRSHGLVDLDG